MEFCITTRLLSTQAHFERVKPENICMNRLPRTFSIMLTWLLCTCPLWPQGNINLTFWDGTNKIITLESFRKIVFNDTVETLQFITDDSISQSLAITSIQQLSFSRAPSEPVLTVGRLSSSATAPMVFGLEQNYPNPFNPATTMRFVVPRNGRVSLKIYNLLGQQLETLFDDEALAGKFYEVRFLATGFSSGLYFARLGFDGQFQVRKMILLK